MSIGRRTYRDVDGHRVEGTWRHVLVRSPHPTLTARYFLTELKVYADGVIDCGEAGITDLSGPGRLFATGGSPSRSTRTARSVFSTWVGGARSRNTRRA